MESLSKFAIGILALSSISAFVFTLSYFLRFIIKPTKTGIKTNKKPDKRFKSGYRTESYNYTKSDVEYQNEITQWEAVIPSNKKKAFISLSIFLISIIAMYLIMFLSK